jgi:mannose-6-phosphate isomerase-like protein (cupin superfamily)
MTTLQKLFLVFMMLLPFFNQAAFSQTNTQPKPQIIALKIDSDQYQEILDGPPSSLGMYSGLVSLMPGDTVGHHNTEIYEEMLVILSGQGEMILEKGNALPLKYGVVAYCPPHTEHDVKNTGTAPLKYIYIASKTK